MSTADIAPTAWPLVVGDRAFTADAACPPAPPRPGPDSTGRPGPSGCSPFCLPLAGYLWVGVQLSLVYHSYIGDAVSREANAYYVFFSNDPHLAAIGFVWNPLTSISEMPLILLKGLWPALTADGFAASIMSAIFMAGCCYQLIRFMEDLGVGRVARWLLLACFALNPMIIYSGGNGMSEALFMFTLLAATRRLAGWLVRGGTRDLVASGVWLALAYAAAQRGGHGRPASPPSWSWSLPTHDPPARPTSAACRPSPTGWSSRRPSRSASSGGPPPAGSSWATPSNSFRPSTGPPPSSS